MKNYSEISNRYMKQNKKRTSLTVLGIILATVLIFAVGTFLLSFRDSMLVEQRRTGGDYEFILRNITSEQVDKIKNNAEVKDTSLLLSSDDEYTIEGKDEILTFEYGNKDYYEKMQTSPIKEGRVPTKENEILINQSVKSLLKVNVGDKINLKSRNGNEKVVEVVGIEEGTLYSGNNVFYVKDYLNDKNLDQNAEYNLYLNLKSGKNKQDIIAKITEQNNINKESINNNSSVLYLTGNGGNQYVSDALRNMAIFVIATIIICTIVVIYNSFNISVIERIRYFGILKAIGATPKQIKRIIYKEGFLMGLIALPLGCIVGFLALKYGIKIFIGDTLMFIESFKVGFYPVIILVTAILVAITIFLSILMPARKANKISAVDAIRNKNEIKLGKLKRRKGRIVGKIFGVEGSIAYKNIRRTPFRFIITCLALTVSIIMFNVFYGFVDFAKQSVMQQFMYSPFDAQLSNEVTDSGLKDEDIKEIESKDFIRKEYKFYIDYANLAIPKDSVNLDYSDKVGRNPFHDSFPSSDMVDASGTQIYVGGNDELNIIDRYIVDGKVDLEKLKKNGVILLDGYQIRNEDGDIESVQATKYKVGDKIRIPKLDNYSRNVENASRNIEEAIKNKDYYELEVVAIANREPLMGNTLYSAPQLMFHEDLFKTMVKDFNYNGMFFDFEGDDEAREEAIKYFSNFADEKELVYQDLGDLQQEVDSIYGQIEFFVYCFNAIVTIISVVNIFNTISTNLLLRRKEFSTLKAIGMTEKQLKKSVLLEGTLYGILSAIIGGGVSAVLLGLLVKLGAGFAEVQYNFDFIAFAISIICAIGVTYIATVIPMNKLKKLTIVEGISEEE